MLRPLQVQSTFELYEYPCKKFPEEIRNRSDPPAPTGEEVCQYLDEFITEKGIKHKFRFNTRITDVRYYCDNEWIIEFSDGKEKRFTNVIICTGLVSVKPKKIDIPGMEQFEWNGGTVIHSSERQDESLLAEQNVIVISNGKSAADAAQAAARIAKENGTTPPIQCARRATWYVPRYIWGVLQYKWAFHTRLGSALLPRHYETRNPILILLHILFTPLKWFLWRIVEILLLVQYRLPWRLQPRMGTILRSALDVSVLITDETHLQKIRSGEVDMRIATVERLEVGKAILSDGTEAPCDIVIQATGWELGFDSFMEKETVLADLDIQEDGVWLYRNMLPTKLKGLAFVGSNTLTFMNIYTSYIQAYWLAGLLAKERPWPTRQHMEDSVKRDMTFKRKWYPNHVLRAASIEMYMQHYHDNLLGEMGARKPFNCLIRPLADLVVPVLPSLMKGTMEPTKETRRAHRKKRRSAEKEGAAKSIPVDIP